MTARTLATIGYQGTAMPAFLSALTDARVELLVDVRAVASSRRPGFSKTALAANLAESGIDYLQLRGLGTPADGRAAARAGRHEEMRRVFLQHMESPEARDQIDALVEVVRSGTRACLLCFEADPEHCHRTLVAAAVAGQVAVRVVHLRPESDQD